MRRWLANALGSALLAGLAVAAPGLPAQAADGVRYVDLVFDEVVVTTHSYGAAYNSLGQLQELKLDVYKPVGDIATDRGLYIWAHGGNFRVGNRGQSGPIRDMARRGWVGISISYRLRPELPGNAAVGAITDPASLPAFIDAVNDAQHDMQAAVRWGRRNAATLGVDSSKIAVGGISAGAITSLMVAFNPNDPGNSNDVDVSSAVAAAVSHAGTYAPVLLGEFPFPGAPPIAVYHGTNDEQVPYPLAPIACALTLLVLNDCEFVTFVGQGHQTMGSDLARDFLYRHVIRGHDELRTPLTIGNAEDITTLAGAELPDAAGLGTATGATAGVVVPSDPNIIVSETEQFVNYIANAAGVPLPE